MARGSQRKQAIGRLERRLGKPERLADIVAETDSRSIEVYPIFDPPEVAEAVASLVRDREMMPSRKIIAVDSVAKFYFEHPQETWTFRDYPNVAPPFDAMFVEYTGLDRIFSRGEWVKSPWMAERFGAFVTSWKPASLPDGYRVPWPEILLPEATWHTLTHPVAVRGGQLMSMGCAYAYSVAADGQMMDEPRVFGPPSFAERLEEYDIHQLQSLIRCHMPPILLSLCFMNCRNVSLEAHEPDLERNRLRRNAGVPPFVRYHTINIEPMKAVLRAEGDAAQVGVKKAMHSVRAHFVHYSEDKPLFGKHVGTFWKPSHVRGSIEAGIVDSDYRVSPPSPSATDPQPETAS